MKFGLMLALLLVGQIALAESIHDKKVKQEMLSRTDLLLTKVQDTRNALKVDDVVTACARIEDLFAIYPEHLKSIGTHMNLFNSKTIKAKNDSLAQLIYIHQQSLICKQGSECEHLDIDSVDKKMKEFKKSLAKQRKTIQKGDTDFDNSFYYEYEF